MLLGDSMGAGSAPASVRLRAPQGPEWSTAPLRALWDSLPPWPVS